MKSIDELIILSESKEAYIGICKCCSTINFIYKNIAIKFKRDEFDYFKTYMENIRTEEFIFESHTGKNVFMSSPIKNIVFCFSKMEVDELKVLLNEAHLMLEVHQALE